MSVLFESLYPAWTLEGNFFGDYNYLDDVIPPNDLVVLNYQLSIIRDSIEKDVGDKWFLVEELIATNESITFDKDEIVNEAIQKIFENIDSLRGVGKRRLITATKEEAQRNLNNFENQLMKLWLSLEQLISMDMFIDASQLNEIQKLIEEIHNFSESSILGTWGTRAKQGTGKRGSARRIMGMLNGLQGALLEAIGTEWFSKRIPNIEAINTAKIEVSGNGQMISDMLFFEKSEIDLMKDIEIVYHYGGDTKGKKTENLGKFLDIIKNHTGKNHIVIDSGAEEMFKKALAGVQAKSGINQMPFNANQRNSFSIEELNDNEFYKRVLEDLGFLYQWGWQYRIDMNETHEDYNAMFNFAVSTKIPNIMQFNKNQFLLTRKGIISYADYFYEEMYAKKRFFKAAKPVSIAYQDIKNNLTF